MKTNYPDDMSLREARQTYFVANQFGADGGYGDRWVKLKLGPITFHMLNTAARIRAVRIHDLHHVVTGYQTDWRGEFEISAWEIATGCADFYAAWYLNLSGLVAGLLSFPGATLRAFARGRRSRNLYHQPYGDEVLGRSVGETRRLLALDRPPEPATAADVAALLGWALLGAPIGALMLVLGIALLPLAPLSKWVASRQQVAKAA